MRMEKKTGKEAAKPSPIFWMLPTSIEAPPMEGTSLQDSASRHCRYGERLRKHFWNPTGSRFDPLFSVRRVPKGRGIF